ncbi:MAG: hypothetical protein S4CHLAM2_10660 [Chlamydiales bacterium]|nr:hypothetical protein [Chlamydiales bacterium]
MFKFLNPGPRYSWKKVVLLIALSTFCLTGGTVGAYLFYRYTQHLHATNASSVVQAVVQATADYTPLQTAYLAEVLELSQDKPVYLSQFEIDEAHERLKATHLIRHALIKKIKPNILYIEYDVRKPLAFLGDYSNTIMDEEGVFVPYLPFYSPRLLPEIYLGAQAPPNPWGESMESKYVEWAHAILARFESGVLKRIDFSQCESPSSGTRQIVLTLEEGTLLRLTPKNYAQELTYYFMILDRMAERVRSSVIDLRNPEVAYITDAT